MKYEVSPSTQEQLLVILKVKKEYKLPIRMRTYLKYNEASCEIKMERSGISIYVPFIFKQYCISFIEERRPFMLKLKLNKKDLAALDV
jgi:hypothetical protein